MITKYAPGYDGKIPYERLRNESCKVPLAMFGETVLYLPLKTAQSLTEQTQPRMKMGLWLGVMERTEETLIGTNRGVVKCRIVNRLPQDQRWSKSRVMEMKGCPWMPVPGVKSDHIPVEIRDDGSPSTQQEECADRGPMITFEEEPRMPTKPSTSGRKEAGMQEFHITQQMIQKYGYTEGCSACEKIQSNVNQGITAAKKLGVHHSTTCRTRVMQEMAEDSKDRHMVEAYQRRNQRTECDAPAATKSESQGSQMNMQNTVRTDGNAKAKKADDSHTIEHSTLRQKETAEETDNKTDKQRGLDRALYKLTENKMDVAEVYSPERITRVARQYGLKAGWSLDFTTADEHGRPWDFDCVYMRNKAVRRLLKDKPTLVIGSPMCTEFSSWMSINHPRMAREVVDERMRKARAHLEFCTKLYNLQISHGRYFLHEHPQSATSWREPCIQRIMGKTGVLKVSADQCQYGLLSRDKTGEGYVRKATSFMTNAPYVALQLQKRCPNRTGRVVHRHVTLEGGRTKPAQIYPEGLCRAICKGLLDQITADQKGQFLLAQLNGTQEEARDVEWQLKDEFKTVETEESVDLQQAWDDVIGAELDPAKVRQARSEEVAYIRKMGLDNKVPVEECLRKTGRKPIQVRWIDINKGDAIHPNYRSRLVAKEINTYKRMDLFAATPPLEAVKMILSMTATSNKN